MSWILSKGSDSVEIQNPERMDTRRAEKSQALVRSAGGVPWVHAKGVRLEFWSASFAELRESEYADLLNFFENVTNGQAELFTLTDQYGVAHNARFVQPRIEGAIVGDSRAAGGTFESGGIDYPTTTRKSPVFECRLELEISAP